MVDSGTKVEIDDAVLGSCKRGTACADLTGVERHRLDITEINAFLPGKDRDGFDRVSDVDHP